MTHAHRFKIDKLIRDNMPALMREAGLQVFERTMEEEEYCTRLHNKLVEEAHEVIQATTQEERIEEMGDLLEVIYSLADFYNLDLSTIETKRLQKRTLRGGFKKRVYNALVEIPAGHPKLAYYQDRPKEYPEITNDI